MKSTTSRSRSSGGSAGTGYNDDRKHRGRSSSGGSGKRLAATAAASLLPQSSVSGHSRGDDSFLSQMMARVCGGGGSVPLL